MLIPIYEKRFSKEVQKAQKRGKDMEKLKDIIQLLLNKKALPIKNRNHKLKGNFKNYWECHIEPDWLLIYKITSTEVIFSRTGSHADLFNQ
jgi:mRNA interferase YafQ